MARDAGGDADGTDRFDRRIRVGGFLRIDDILHRRGRRGLRRGIPVDLHAPEKSVFVVIHVHHVLNKARRRRHLPCGRLGGRLPGGSRVLRPLHFLVPVLGRSHGAVPVTKKTLGLKTSGLRLRIRLALNIVFVIPLMIMIVIVIFLLVIVLVIVIVMLVIFFMRIGSMCMIACMFTVGLSAVTRAMVGMRVLARMGAPLRVFQCVMHPFLDFVERNAVRGDGKIIVFQRDGGDMTGLLVQIGEIDFFRVTDGNGAVARRKMNDMLVAVREEMRVDRMQKAADLQASVRDVRRRFALQPERHLLIRMQDVIRQSVTGINMSAGRVVAVRQAFEIGAERGHGGEG